MATAASTPENDHQVHSPGDNYNRHSNHEREKLNRNTLNQRASRARRKDYVNSLESKVREYEAQSVQATEEVQNAARRVADENRVLKEEMRMLREQVRCLEGVLRRRGSRQSQSGRDEGANVEDDAGDGQQVESQVELDAAWKRLQHEDRLRRRDQSQSQQQQQQQQVYHPDQSRWQEQQVQSHASLMILDDTPGDAAAVQYPSPPGDGEANGQRRRRLHGPVMTVHHPIRSIDEDGLPSSSSFNAYHDAETDEDMEPPSQQQNHHHDSENSSLVYSPSSDMWAQQGYNTAHGHDQARQQYSITHQNVPSSSSSSSRSVFPTNTTPCEEAALIIASMRGVGPSNPNYQVDILPELGCDDTNRAPSCTVDNGRLFTIMDSDRG